MQGRRNFLLSAGVLTAASGVRTVSASNRSGGRSAEVINKAILSGISNNGVEGARQSMKDLGLNPTVEEVKLADQIESKENQQSSPSLSEDEQQISPEFVYDDPENSNSSLIVAASPAIGSDSEVWMAVNMRLKDSKFAARNSWWVPDAIGIGFREKDWAPVGAEPAINASNDHTAKFTREDVADDALAGTVDIENHLDNDSGPGRLPDSVVSMTAKFRLRDRGEPSILWGSYTHTFAGTPRGVIDNISGGWGGLSVELSWGTKAWSISHPTDPEDDL